jgi:hypothetical protein
MTNLDWLRFEQNGEALPELLDLLAMFRLPPNDPNPARTGTAMLASRCAGEARKLELADRFLETVNGLEMAAFEAIGKSERDPRILCTEDFQPWGVQPFRVSNDDPTVLFAGILGALPANHPARKIEWADYRHSTIAQGEPAVVLGPSLSVVAGSSPPRAYYFVSEVERLTRRWADRQQQQERERVERDRRDELEQRRRFWNSEVGIQERKRRLLEQLREKGQIPEEIIEQPTVLAPGGAPYR